MPVMHERVEVERNIERLVGGAHILGVPVILTEQYVKGLGPTIEPIRRAFEETSGYRPFEKDCFSAHDQLTTLAPGFIRGTRYGRFRNSPRKRAEDSCRPLRGLSSGRAPNSPG